MGQRPIILYFYKGPRAPCRVTILYITGPKAQCYLTIAKGPAGPLAMGPYLR